MTDYNPEQGEPADVTAKILIFIANQRRSPATAVFGGTHIYAEPDDVPDNVLRRWQRERDSRRPVRR